MVSMRIIDGYFYLGVDDWFFQDIGNNCLKNFEFKHWLADQCDDNNWYQKFLLLGDEQCVVLKVSL